MHPRMLGEIKRRRTSQYRMRPHTAEARGLNDIDEVGHGKVLSAPRLVHDSHHVLHGFKQEAFNHIYHVAIQLLPPQHI